MDKDKPKSDDPSSNSQDPVGQQSVNAATQTSSTTNQPSSTATSQPHDDKVRLCKLSEYKEVALSLALAFKDDPVALYFINVPDTQHWSAERKWQLHLRINEYIVRWHMLAGRVTSIGPNYSCVALWTTPPSVPAGREALKHFSDSNSGSMARTNSDLSAASSSSSTSSGFPSSPTKRQHRRRRWKIPPLPARLADWKLSLQSGVWKLYWHLSPMGRKRWFSLFIPKLHQVKRETLGERRDHNSWYLVYLGTRPEARRRGYAKRLMDDVTALCDAQGEWPIYLESTSSLTLPIYEKYGFRVKNKIVMPEQKPGEDVVMQCMVREPVRRGSSNGRLDQS